MVRSHGKELKQRSAGTGDRRTKRRHNFVCLSHCRCNCNLMRCPAVNVEEIRLDKGKVHRLGGTSGNDEILLVAETFLDSFINISSASAGHRLPDSPVHKVKPGKKIFRPKFEGVEQDQIVTIGECQFFFAITDKTVDRFVIVIVSGIADECINAVHLHFNFPAYGNFTS